MKSPHSKFTAIAPAILSKMMTLNLSQAEAAKLAGVSFATLNRCLVGRRRIRSTTAAKLTRAFGADVVEICPHV